MLLDKSYQQEKLLLFPKSSNVFFSLSFLTFFSDVRKSADLLPRSLPNLIVDKFGVSSLLSHLSDRSIPSDICHLLVDTFFAFYSILFRALLFGKLFPFPWWRTITLSLEYNRTCQSFSCFPSNLKSIEGRTRATTE